MMRIPGLQWVTFHDEGQLRGRSTHHLQEEVIR